MSSSGYHLASTGFHLASTMANTMATYDSPAFSCFSIAMSQCHNKWS